MKLFSQVDDFEEVVIPDVKKNLTKMREFFKEADKLNGKSMSSRKLQRIKKDEQNDKTNDEDVLDCEKDNDIGEDGLADCTDDLGEKALDSDDDYDETLDRMNSDSETAEGANDTESNAPFTKYTSDLSNPSSPASECKSLGDPFDNDFLDSQESQMTSASDFASDVSNEATDIPLSSLNDSPNSLDQSDDPPAIEEESILKRSDASMENKKAEGLSCSPGSTTSALLVSVEKDSKEINETCNQEEDTNECNVKISANNLEVDAEGRCVIWTRYCSKIAHKVLI